VSALQQLGEALAALSGVQEDRCWGPWQSHERPFV